MLQSKFSKIYTAAHALGTRRVSMDVDQIPFHFERVPLRKIINWIRVEASMSVKPEKPWGWPTHLQIEPTTLCNLRCALCPVTEGLQRPTGHMSLDLFKKVIDQTGEYVFLILFWDWGEPFLNPAAYDMIRYAKARGIKIVSSTNGHVFANREQAEKLVRSGIDAIIFALDGIHQETYERYRERGNLQTALQGIRNVVECKRSLRSRAPFVNFRFLVTSHNQHEVPGLEEFVRPLGVDMLSLKTLNLHSNAVTAKGMAFVPQACEYSRFKYDPDTGERIRRDCNPCKALWNNPAIHWDGKIAPCTDDAHNRYVMGDLSRTTFKDIWQGEPFARFRRQFRLDYRQIPVCDDCTFAFVGGGLGVERIPKAVFFDAPEQEQGDKHV